MLVRRIDAMRRGLISVEEFQAAVSAGADPKERIEVEETKRSTAKRVEMPPEGGVPQKAGKTTKISTGMTIETVPGA